MVTNLPIELLSIVNPVLIHPWIELLFYFTSKSMHKDENLR